MEALSQLQPQLAKAKRDKAWHHTLLLLEQLALGEVAEPALGRVKEQIAELNPSVGCRLLLTSCGMGAGPALRLLHGPAMSAYRSHAGQWLMGRKI